MQGVTDKDKFTATSLQGNQYQVPLKPKENSLIKSTTQILNQIHITMKN